MQSLAQILSALQAELGSALTSQLSLPGGVRMQADRVTVSLQFSTHEGPDSQVEFLWATPSANTNGTLPKSLHTLTLEFKPATPELGVTGVPSSSRGAAPPQQQALTGEDEIKRALSLIFGQPGFDSSARATVFREAFADLSPEQAQRVIRSISGDAPADDSEAKRARGLLLKLLKSAPLDDLDQSKRVLEDVLTQNPLDSVLRLVTREWKTQEDWL